MSSSVIELRKINERYENGNTLLHIATRENNYETIEKLLKKGANVNVQNDEGNTPLHFALDQSEVNENIVKLLLEYGADPNIRNDRKLAPFFHYLLEARKNRNLDIVIYLLNYGADPNLEDDSYDNPISYSFEVNDKELFLLLINSKNGGNLNMKHGDGKTLLHRAVLEGKENYPFLLENGANPNIKDNEGNIPLYYAYTHKWLNNKLPFLLEDLIRYGSNREEIMYRKSGISLFLSSREMILENLNEFLRTLSRDRANYYYIDKSHPEILIPGKLIGRGATGLAYDIGNKIVKVMPVCENTRGYNGEICKDMLNGGNVIKIPSSWNKKEILLMPNLVGEMAINMILNNHNPDFITEAFPYIYGFEIDEVTKTAYSTVEKLQDWKSHVYDNDSYQSPSGIIKKGSYNKNLYYSIFQIAYFLLNAQLVYRFTHYDLHWGNIMSRPKSNNLVYEYLWNIDGEDYFIYTLYDFETVIIDLGWARLETEKYVIAPKIKYGGLLQSDPEVIIDMINMNEFNPYYDLLFLLVYLIKYNGPHDLKDPDTVILFNLLKFLLPIDYELNEFSFDQLNRYIEDHFVNKGNHGARPNASKITTDYIDGKYVGRLETLQGFLNNLVKFLYNNQSYFSEDENYERYLSRNDILVSKKKLDISRYRKKSFNLPLNNPKYQKNISFALCATMGRPTCGEKKISDCMSYTQLSSTSNKSIPHSSKLIPWIYTHTNSSLNYYRDQILSYVKISARKALDQGYEFDLSCCRVDVQSYMRSYYVESGVSINATFFQINSDFLPIGYYRSDDIISNIEIPAIYKDYYGAIVIDDDGYIKCDFRVEEDYLKNTYKKYATCGPVLLNNGQKIFDRETINKIITTDEGEQISIFKCYNQGYDQKVPNDVKSCSMIRPGTLQHAGNPNPRSVLAFKKDSPLDPVFIYIEGRDARGPGADLITLTDYLFDEGYLHAINLDGGMSSQLVWRDAVDDHIYTCNPMHNFSYPVGSIISCVRKRT